MNARWLADKPAVIAPDCSLSWRGLNRAADQFANGLLSAGCVKGDRVGVVMNNSAATLYAILGTIKAGGVVAPLNTQITDNALLSMLTDAGVKAVTASGAHAGRLSALPDAARLLLLEDGEPGAASTPGWTPLAQWMEAQSDAPCEVDIGRDDICNIIYSSGTTGRPKGITHPHGVRLDWAHDLAHALRYDSGARTLIVTGLYSNISWVGVLCTLLLGGTLIIRNGFDAGDVLETIQRERISHVSMVPVQYQRILEHHEFAVSDTSSMRAMMSCGSALPLRIKAQLFDRFSCGVIELYGSTEGAVTTLAPEDAAGRVASVGKPLPGEDLMIMDESGVLAEPGAPGEVLTLSRFVMAGYWNAHEETEKAFWIDTDGRRWLRTGDIGRLDEEGFLYITDRKKDVIISGGQNIYPADLEAVLLQHDAIRDCAVFGVPSERWGETPLALLVVSATAEIDDQALLEWANARLGKQQRIHAIERREALPRNANGKLLKRELRAPYWASELEGAPR